jgi:hypothetical protein
MGGRDVVDVYMLVEGIVQMGKLFRENVLVGTSCCRFGVLRYGSFSTAPRSDEPLESN